MTPELLWVLDRARELGLLGPGPVEPHVAHAEAALAAVSDIIDVHAGSALRALDLGSGGGLPGLVLALAMPMSRWVLLDASERRTAFLRSAVTDVGVSDRVEVVRARAEVAGRDARWRQQFDLVTARSFGPPSVTAECGAPFLRPGGMLVVSEPPEPDPTRWPDVGCAQVGLSLRARGSWAVLELTEPLSDKFPRRDGLPAKRPLW
jgi:16S rRNA (guanine527-N7)-methyltransferase